MKWTTQKPTAPGFYWCRCVGSLSGKPYETIVKVYSSRPKHGPLDRVFWDGDNFSLESDSFIAWGSKPIPEPET